MKKILVVIFSISIIFSTLCFAESKQRRDSAISFPNQKTTNSAFPDVLSPFKSLLRRILRRNGRPTSCPSPFVKDVILSKEEVFSRCPANQICLTTPQIEVYTDAKVQAEDALVYHYEILEGKIIGQGSKVIWDLSDVNAGKYTISVWVDNGCGLCGQTKVTKEVVVKECLDYK